MKRRARRGKRSYSRGCHGKVRYPDHQSATAAMRAIGEQPRRQKTIARAYQCGACGGWHLTSKE